MIIIDRRRPIGPLLRQLRLAAGLTVRDLAAAAHISKSGVSKRELHDGISTAGLVDHLGALGYDVIVVRRRRTTGTGWPA